VRSIRRSKRHCATLLLALGGLALFAPHATAAPTAMPGIKRALLIGVNNYQFVPGLQGSINDVQTMREVLITRWGFSEANIRLLTDEAATRVGILAALEELVAAAGPDDTVYFHFSGHGSQVQDLNGDEDDGLDETIVPVDGRSPGVPDIVDDELDAIFSRLKTRNTVIVLDSCHSGTATRGMDVRARGVPQDDRVDLYQSLAVQTRAAVDTPAARSVVLSAAAPNEEALDGPVDGRYHGFFTFALARSMSAAPPGASARDVFGGLARELNRIQAQFGRTSMPQPQLEGSEELVSRPLLQPMQAVPPATAGKANLPPRLAWLDVRPAEPGSALLLRGALLGAQPGSAWAIYPAADAAFVPGRALATATVTEMRGADAFARLQPPQAALGPGSRAVALMPPAAPGTIAIGMLNVPGDRRRELEAVIRRDIRNVNIVAPGAPARFMVDLQGESVRLLAADGSQVVGVYPAASNQWGPGMAQAVSRMAVSAELLGLDNPASQLQLTVQLAGRPALATRGVLTTADTQAARLHIRAAGEPRTAENSLQLDVSVGTAAYLTIADVDSEGGVNLLFPNGFQRPGFHSDGALQAGEHVLLPDSLQEGNRAGFHWDYSPPRGTDTIRIFASTDLATASLIRQRIASMRRPTSQSGAAASRAVPVDVAALRNDLIQLATRGIATIPDRGPHGTGAAGVQVIDWTAASVTVQVEDRP
jgi:hypothetical protein